MSTNLALDTELLMKLAQSVQSAVCTTELPTCIPVWPLLTSTICLTPVYDVAADSSCFDPCCWPGSAFCPHPDASPPFVFSLCTLTRDTSCPKSASALSTSYSRPRCYDHLQPPQAPLPYPCCALFLITRSSSPLRTWPHCPRQPRTISSCYPQPISFICSSL